MDNILRILGIILILVTHTISEPIYSVAAPNIIRQNSLYRVVVSYHQADSLDGRCSNVTSGRQLRVVARILRGPVDGTNNVVVRRVTGIVPISTSRILSLQIPTLNEFNYVLEVNGTGDTTFNHVAQLSASKKEISIFIQTDKTIYQLGQSVRFRIVVTDRNLLPHGHDPIQVSITDADNNRIRQWDDYVPHNGIFEGSFQLSSQPVLGFWTLAAKVKDTTAQDGFTVSEYVLPRFEASLQVPRIVTIDDRDLVITISALYTFGGPVTGSFRLSVLRGYCSLGSFGVDSLSRCGSTPVNVTGQISGSTDVRITLTDLYGSSAIYSTTLTAFVEVTEQSTEITRNDTLLFQVYDNRQYLTVVLDSTFKPKSTFPITIQLREQNGLPVTNVDGDFNVTYVFASTPFANNPPPFTSVLLHPSTSGTATLNVVPPVGEDLLAVQATYKTLTANGLSTLAQSLTNKYLTISVSNNNPTVGSSLKISVKTTFEMTASYLYQVVGRGSILLAQTVQLTNPTSSTSFSVKLTREMAPHVRIVVYYTTGCGEIVGDSIDIAVAGLIQTPVTLRFSNTTVEPGQSLTLEITSRPNSDVALSGIDQSVLLLSAANDITQSEIYSEILAYDIGNNYYDYSDAGLIRRPGYGGSFDELFSFAGLLFFSNGLRSKANTCYRPLLFNRLQGIDVINVPIPLAVEAIAAPDARQNQALVQPDRIRNYFPESWLWFTPKTGADGKVTVPLTAPDTLTKYVTTGFAVSQQFGLGVTNKPYNVTVFRNFFIVANLPFSVVRNEKITVQLQIFNNINERLDPVVVTLNNTKGEYIIVEAQKGTSPPATSISKNIVVGANQVGIVTFIIQPVKVGYIQLLFKAASPYAGDAIEIPLLVRAEGSPQYFSRSILIDLRRVRSFTTSVAITIPTTAVTGSEYIEVQIVGNIMASFAANIANLIQLPYGCGEQNMLNFAPDAVILKYLDATNLLTDSVRAQLLNYLLTGYQTELGYKRSDGSFSAFGQADPSGSTWLTAFVLKSFEQAKDYITIDANVISKARQFIISKQRPNGEFFEDGRVIHKAMQGGGATAGLALTAYTLISLQQNVTSNTNSTTEAIRRALRYVEFNYDSSNSTYDACITAYALHLSNSSEKDRAFARINALRTVQGEFVFWHVDVAKPSGSDWYYNAPASYDVEATGYCLLTNIYRQESTDSVFPIVRWLIASRTALGGFSSSQDTVIGIEALAAFAPSIATTATTNVRFDISYLSNTSTFYLNKQNELVLQKLQLQSQVRSVQIRATGNGFGIVQVVWNYNIVKNVSRDPSFRVLPTVSRPSNKTYRLNICQSYLLDGNTNMVITQLDTLSGYTWNRDSCATPDPRIGLSRVEFSQSETSVNFYFTGVPRAPNQICLSCSAVQIYVVTSLQPALIATYDYYETAKRTEVYYSL